MPNKPFIIAHQVVNQEVDNREKLGKLLEKLKSKNVWGIEFDIRQTKDERFIVCHDKNFPQSEKLIKKHTLEELKKEAIEKNLSFLMLEEVLEIVPTEFQIQIDIKDKKTNIGKLLKIIRDYQISGRLIISSLYPKNIFLLSKTEIKKRWLSTNPLHFISAMFPIKTAKSCLATGIAPHYSLLSKNLVQKAHQNNFALATWTVNKEKLMQTLEKHGVDCIITDLPKT